MSMLNGHLPAAVRAVRFQPTITLGALVQIALLVGGGIATFVEVRDTATSTEKAQKASDQRLEQLATTSDQRLGELATSIQAQVGKARDDLTRALERQHDETERALAELRRERQADLQRLDGRIDGIAPPRAAERMREK